MKSLPLPPFSGRWRASGRTKHRCVAGGAGGRVLTGIFGRSIGATDGEGQQGRNEPDLANLPPATEIPGGQHPCAAFLPRLRYLGGRRYTVAPHFQAAQHARRCLRYRNKFREITIPSESGGRGMRHAARPSDEAVSRGNQRGSGRLPVARLYCRTGGPGKGYGFVHSVHIASRPVEITNALGASLGQIVSELNNRSHADEFGMEDVQTCRTIRTKMLNRKAR
jgi:hypothetical protein